MDSQDMKTESLAILSSMLEQLGIAAEASVREKNGHFEIYVEAEDVGRLIGRRGVHIDALEQVLNRILKKKAGGEEIPFVGIAVPEAPGKREPRPRESGEQLPREERRQPRERQGEIGDDPEMQRLQCLALDKAKEVKRWGQTMELGPYNAAQRKAIHTALGQDRSIVARSVEIPGNPHLKMILLSVAEKPSDTPQN